MKRLLIICIGVAFTSSIAAATEFAPVVAQDKEDILNDLTYDLGVAIEKAYSYEVTARDFMLAPVFTFVAEKLNAFDLYSVNEGVNAIPVRIYRRARDGI